MEVPTYVIMAPYLDFFVSDGWNHKNAKFYLDSLIFVGNTGATFNGHVPVSPSNIRPG
jgi:hypothetical protein